MIFAVRVLARVRVCVCVERERMALHYVGPPAKDRFWRKGVVSTHRPAPAMFCRVRAEGVGGRVRGGNGGEEERKNV